MLSGKNCLILFSFGEAGITLWNMHVLFIYFALEWAAEGLVEPLIILCAFISFAHI